MTITTHAHGRTTTAHHLRLFYLHTYASESEAADAGVQRWHVSAEVLSEDGLPLAHLGDVHLVRADPLGAADLHARLSAPDLALKAEAEAALDPGCRDLGGSGFERLGLDGGDLRRGGLIGGGLDRACSDRACSDRGGLDPCDRDLGGLSRSRPGSLLFVTAADLRQEWSGLGLGVAMCGLALRELRFGCHSAICHPERVQPAGASTQGPGYAREELAAAWPRLGFRPLSGGVRVLDLTGHTFPRLMDRLLAGHDPPW